MNYPPGVSRLPDEEVFECSHCYAKNQHDDYKSCPKCGEHNLCKKCNYCHSCEEDIDPNDKYIECIWCNIKSSDSDWDESTKVVFGEDIVPIIEGCDDSGELWYICPACNEQVDNDEISVIPDED